MTVRMIIAALVALLALPAFAQDDDQKKPPERKLPAPVLAGLQLVERQFGQALAEDCAPERCFAKGCIHIEHAIVDQEATSSLPGLGLDPGPGNTPGQVYLTTVECSFAHERSVRAKDAKALAARLKAKLSRGWTRVDVVFEKLKPVPEFLRDAPEPIEPEGEPEIFEEETPDDEPVAEPPPAPEWDAMVAGRELWLSVLPHFPWMIGLLLFTLLALILIWAARRLGRPSPEEQMLLARMMNDGGAAADDDEDEDGEVEPEGEPEPDHVSERHRLWRERLAKSDDEADSALHVLVTDLLRTGERRMLAKAVILFPDAFPRVFPQGGDFASSKFELAEYLKHADPESLPSDEAFFDKLDRYAMAAELAAHPDTALIRSLHDDFGTAALVDAVGRMSARHGALLFAVAPEAMQHEAVRRLDGRVLAALIDQLMRSNRMDPAEMTHLLDVLSALRAGEPMPAPPSGKPITDRGSAFDATGALSIMLPHVNPETRKALVDAAVARNAGLLPEWMNDTLYGEMLLRMPDETRTDLMLGVDINPLSAWLSVQSEASRGAIEGRLPNALRAALSGAERPAPGRRFALASEGRAALSAGVQRYLTRADAPFHTLLV